jgi:hypothetical protein
VDGDGDEPAAISRAALRAGYEIGQLSSIVLTAPTCCSQVRGRVSPCVQIADVADEQMIDCGIAGVVMMTSVAYAMQHEPLVLRRRSQRSRCGCTRLGSAASCYEAVFYTIKDPHQQTRELYGLDSFQQVVVV